MGFPRVWSIAAASAAVLVAAAVTGVVHHRLLERSGLTRSATADGEFEWKGFVIFPGRDAYRLVVHATTGVRVELDGATIIDPDAVRREARVQNSRGLHELRVRLTGDDAARAPRLLWARGDATPLDVPRVLLVSDVVSQAEMRQRIWLAALAPYAPLALSLLGLALVTLAGAAVLRRTFDAGLGPAWIWIAVGVLFGTGLLWGLPDPYGWAPDELNPAAARDALDMRFGGGWATLYPPLHFALFAAADAPFFLFIALGLGEFTDLRFYTFMYVAGRALSLAMALGIVAMTFSLAREIAGARAGAIAAAVLVAALPLTYYAKTANLDVPYVFWMTLSMVFFSRAVRDGRARDFYLLALTATIAVCTKDQAYGFYVLPALYMIVGRWLPRASARRGIPPARVLAGMAALVIAGVVILHNVPFNARGFVEHLRIMAGPGSERFRMFEPTLAGHAGLFVSAFRQIAEGMSWPLFLAAIAAVIVAIRTRHAAITWLLLPVASYYLTLIAVVGYHYDRFFLGAFVLLAIAAGWWIDRWTRAGVAFRRWRLALAGAAFVYAFTRVIALDVLMVRDSRYEVERWMVARAGSDDRVVAAGVQTYLPRRSRVLYQVIAQDVAELDGVRPEYVIVNPGFSARREPDSRRHEMYDALRSGAAGYDLVLQHRTRLPWSPLNLERRFVDPDHDQFSNLTKINPLIEIYRRRAEPIPATASSPLLSSPAPTSR
jgi:4-amino-4-deoxy-L-arabinose transferase-like glycosyltransferase